MESGARIYCAHDHSLLPTATTNQRSARTGLRRLFGRWSDTFVVSRDVAFGRRIFEFFVDFADISGAPEGPLMATMPLKSLLATNEANVVLMLARRFARALASAARGPSAANSQVAPTPLRNTRRPSINLSLAAKISEQDMIKKQGGISKAVIDSMRKKD